jgi:hypothetical protein
VTAVLSPAAKGAVAAEVIAFASEAASAAFQATAFVV